MHTKKKKEKKIMKRIFDESTNVLFMPKAFFLSVSFSFSFMYLVILKLIFVWWMKAIVAKNLII